MDKVASQDEPSKKSIDFILWVIFFCFSCCSALIFQKILLPIISPESSATGLLPNDATYFHQVASKLAEDIRQFGWSRWGIFPANGAAGNVAILAVVYVFFGNDPAYLLPINAGMHALGGLLIFKLVQTFTENESLGKYAGIIAATLFVIFPSALSWYGQNHKDVYAIVGSLLIFLGLIRAVGWQASIEPFAINYFLVLIGIFLLGIVRPYSLKLMLMVTLIPLLTTTLISMYQRTLHRNMKLLTLFAFTVIALAITGKILSNAENAQSGFSYEKWHPSNSDSLNAGSLKLKSSLLWSWERTDWLPLVVQRPLETVAKTRAGLIDYGIKQKANTMIDVNQKPKSLPEVLAYLPRAIQIGTFAPFPSNWFDSISPIRLIATFEMFIYYICLPGILLLLIHSRSHPVLLAIYLACAFLTILGFTIANLGTLYRLRYAYLFILLSLGILGWATWISKTKKFARLKIFLKAQVENFPVRYQELSSNQSDLRKKTISSSIAVMALTLVCFIGFFIRDIMMANTYGLNANLDYFFVAMMIPMFFVTTLTIPLGSAFVPFYLELKGQFSDFQVNGIIGAIAFVVTLGLFLLCLLIYPIMPWLYEVFYSSRGSEGFAIFRELSLLALPLLLLSGVMIIGNSILNADSKAVFSSAAQLVVPATVLIVVAFFGKELGVEVVLYAMVAGQIINLVIVEHKLRSYKTSVLPQVKLLNLQQVSLLLKQYWPLMGTAIFIGLSAPVSTFLAMLLPIGAVSEYTLGSKVVLFATGLLGAVITTVMLPYFSNLITRNEIIDARRELSFFLLVTTFISVPLSIGIFMSSEFIVDLMSLGGSFDEDAKQQVARVMKYSVVQLPFFVSNALLLRFAISTKHVYAVLITAMLGLLVNVIVSIFLMKHMGVAGIAIGSSVSTLLSTIMLALVLVRRWHINVLDLIVMLLNWLLFLTLLVVVHFKNLPSVYIVTIAYLVLMAGYFKSLISMRGVKGFVTE